MLRFLILSTLTTDALAHGAPFTHAHGAAIAAALVVAVCVYLVGAFRAR
jgi:hypothetical protein